MFRWVNMLLCCTECGRIKGTQFPLANEHPLLIDPSVDEPWEFLDFDPETGNIVPRYDPDLQAYLPKGEQTVQVLQFDRREAMARGYQRTFRRIRATFEQALEQANLDADALLEDLRESDNHGLLGWCFDGLGSQISPFADVRIRHPEVWEFCQQGYQQR